MKLVIPGGTGQIGLAVHPHGALGVEALVRVPPVQAAGQAVGLDAGQAVGVDVGVTVAGPAVDVGVGVSVGGTGVGVGGSGCGSQLASDTAKPGSGGPSMMAPSSGGTNVMTWVSP